MSNFDGHLRRKRGRPKAKPCGFVDGYFGFLVLSQGQVAKVSLHRFAYLNQFKWHAWWCKYTKSFYALRWVMLPSGKRVDVKLHREILGLGYGDKREGDHINHDTLDNTDDNLRIPPTKSHQNANQRIRSDNVSGYKGVSFEKRNQKWYARIQINGKEKFLGYFDEAKEAGRAYEKYAKEFLGEYACIDRRMKNAA